MREHRLSRITPLFLACFLIGLIAPVAQAAIFFAETQIELEWQAGDLTWIAREVVEIAFDETSLWASLDARVPIQPKLSLKKQFGYQLALSKNFDGQHLTLGWQQTFGKPGLIYLQLAFPW